MKRSPLRCLNSQCDTEGPKMWCQYGRVPLFHFFWKPEGFNWTALEQINESANLVSLYPP